MIACMGGFCYSRDKCANYLLGDFYRQYSERLCGIEEEPEYICRKEHGNTKGKTTGDALPGLSDYSL